MRRLMLRSVAVLTVAIVFLPLWLEGAGASEPVKGRARVSSGDTMVVQRQRFRLQGIDAPETDQYCENEFGRPYQCGLQALDALKSLIGRHDVACVAAAQVDEQGFVPATCYAGDMNLNTQMVRTGWAVALADERPDYQSLEARAKSQKLGIWALKFDHPAEWRKIYGQ